MSTEAACPEKQGRPSRPRPSAWPGLSTCGPTAWGRRWVVVGPLPACIGSHMVEGGWSLGRSPFRPGLASRSLSCIFFAWQTPRWFNVWRTEGGHSYFSRWSPASAGEPFQIGPPRSLAAPASSVKLACSLGRGSGHPVVLLGSSPFGCLTKRDSFFFPQPSSWLPISILSHSPTHPFSPPTPPS